MIIYFLCAMAWAQSEINVPDIQVYGEPKSSALESVPTVAELSGHKLQRKKQSTIGETLGHETGVASTFFGPNASRPVIRGQEGDRVRVLQNGTGVLDASAASQDHAVALEPLTVERIEVVRGPGALLYGSSAVGGVVNITTNRIPQTQPGRFGGKVEARGSTNDNGRGAGLLLNSGLGKNFAVHADGAAKAADDYHSKGDTRVENSAARTFNEALGASFVTERGFIGSSFSNYQSSYGVVAEKAVRINLFQQRADLEGEIRDWAGLRSVRGKFTSSAYKHNEVENGILGTTFKNQGQEARLEFRHRPFFGFGGMFGLQATQFDFSAKGDEAFLPGTRNESQALFLFEEKDGGKFRPSFGIRVEEALVKSKDDPNPSFGTGEQKNFSNLSGALGFLQELTAHYALVLNGSFTERAPNYQELFANGPHVATHTFEVGDKTLQREQSQAVELSVRHKGALGQGSLGVFMQDYKDYIALSPTGGTSAGSDPLPIYAYVQTNARFVGVELDFRHNISHLLNSGTLEFELKVDWLQGKNRNTGDNLPRVTPMRETVALIHKTEHFQIDFEVQRIERQGRTAPNETPTGDYTLVNLGFEQPLKWEKMRVSLFGRLNNLFDVEARNHVSIIKDAALLPGRNFTAGVQAAF